MKYRILSFGALALCTSLAFVSCKKEVSSGTAGLQATGTQSLSATGTELTSLSGPAAKVPNAKFAAEVVKAKAVDNLYKDFVSQVLASKAGTNAIAPSACTATPFYRLTDTYFAQFGALEYQLYGTYAAINQLWSIIDDGPQYFGADGENTHTVVKTQRNLEQFWDMPDQVQINGEHNSTLDNRDRIATIYQVFAGYSRDDAYAVADIIIAINKQSPVFTETPLLSFDAFATRAKLIVLGDGIVKVLTQLGLDAKVVIPGILSHEWAHQIQFVHSQQWFGTTSWPGTGEFTRATELEADFFSSYFLTHKRGETFNWKGVAQFFTLFYNIGDCYFESTGHHGTPTQRLASARLGYLLAAETLPHGHILSADDVHDLYLAAYNSIIAGTVSTQQALASLKSSDLKTLYKNIAAHRAEIQAIAKGTLSAKAVENLK